jgi:P27 family predicted phage terminase small subunit
MAGRRPTPTALKELAGNPGKRPLNKREPKPRVKAPVCPAWLKGEARSEYRRAARLLVEMRVLTEADRATLLAYAVAYARWVEAEAAMAKPDFTMVASTDKGYQHVSPWFTVANTALKQLRAFAVELGLTPASRSRIKAVLAEDEKSLAELLFEGVNQAHG